MPSACLSEGDNNIIVCEWDPTLSKLCFLILDLKLSNEQTEMECAYMEYLLSVLEIISLDYYVPLPKEVGSVGVCA